MAEKPKKPKPAPKPKPASTQRSGGHTPRPTGG